MTKGWPDSIGKIFVFHDLLDDSYGSFGSAYGHALDYSPPTVVPGVGPLQAVLLYMAP